MRRVSKLNTNIYIGNVLIFDDKIGTVYENNLSSVVWNSESLLVYVIIDGFSIDGIIIDYLRIPTGDEVTA
jgi:hypothetical protein